MTIYFSQLASGFFDTSMITYPSLPTDVVEVSASLMVSLKTTLDQGNYQLQIQDGTVVAITITPTLAPVTEITPLEFKARFDTSEWYGILGASTTDPIVLGWVFEASAASYIDLTSPDTTLGLTYLSTRSPSLLAASRIPVLLQAS
jgi:hypothetical protein